MRKLKTIILVALSVTVLPASSIANEWVWTDYGYEMNWTSGNLEISTTQWSTISKLQTYNDVTVRMYGGGANQFYMYDNSELTRYGGSINFLYLYDNATASFLGGSAPMEIYVDPANTGWVKLYADEDTVRFEPYGPYGEGTYRGQWLSGGSFNIDLRGNGAYAHVQVVPEPATLFLLGMGILALCKRR